MTDLDRIKSAVNIVDLVGKHHPLNSNGSGRRYVKAAEHDSLVIDTKEQSYF